MSYVGSWSTSTTSPGYWGSNYRHDGNTTKGTKTATFTPNLPVAGTYQVYMRYPSRSDYAGNVPVDIVHADGTTAVVVNQKVNGGTWNLLGTFNFNVGTGGNVRIRTTATTGYVVADAVRWTSGATPVSAPTPNLQSLSYNFNSVRATIRQDRDGAILLEWPTMPAAVYSLLRSMDGGATWAEAGKVIGDGSEKSLQLPGEEPSALFRIQAETEH